jgi:hypothetical protein
MVIRPASGLTAWVLRRTGFGGVTLPWGIYILPERLHDEPLRRHELEHARQIEQYGVIGFYVRYAWYTLRHGYHSNPLEVQARTKE